MVLRGYGGGAVRTVGKAEVILQVDLIEAKVDVLVVDDEVQAVPVLIGQTFINKAGVTLVVMENKLRLFREDWAKLPELEQLPPSKLNLWTKEAVVLPSNTIGFLEVAGPEDFEGDVFIEAISCTKPGAEYMIPSCIIKGRGGIISIRNIASCELVVPLAKLVARGQPCKPAVGTQGVSVLTITLNNLQPFRLEEILRQTDETLTKEQQQTLLDALHQYRDCFAQNTRELGKTNVTEMQIRLTSDEPVTYRPYRLSFAERETARNIIQDLLDNGIIRESSSPYSSPILLVSKKNGETRMCVDYRKLNAKTIKDRFPLPRVDEYLDRVQGCKYFTTLDLASGYHQIPVAAESIDKTAFITPDGHYEYLRMPFGLVNAPAVFQRAINTILGNLRFTTALAYLDDILLPSANFEQGISALTKVLEVFRNAGLTFRLTKCHFFQSSIEYLGHELTLNGIKPGASKTNAINL